MTLKDHHREIFVPIHKTNILPLRWFANEICHRISMWFFHIGLDLNDRWTYEWDTYKFRHFLMEKIGWVGYKLFNYPYLKWGTTYKFDSERLAELKKEMQVGNWDDYDSNGIPYWDYLWSTDEETGDGWRLVLKD